MRLVGERVGAKLAHAFPQPGPQRAEAVRGGTRPARTGPKQLAPRVELGAQIRSLARPHLVEILEGRGHRLFHARG